MTSSVTSAGMRATGVAAVKSGARVVTVCVPQLCGHFVCTNSNRSAIPSSRIVTLTRLTQGEAGVS